MEMARKPEYEILVVADCGLALPRCLFAARDSRRTGGPLDQIGRPNLCPRVLGRSAMLVRHAADGFPRL